MSEKITKRRLADRKRGLTDWARVDSMSEDELERAIAEDPEAQARGLDWTRARLVLPRRKESIHLRIDPDVLDWFRAQGKGYQTQINAVLRTYVEAHRDQPQTPMDRG